VPKESQQTKSQIQIVHHRHRKDEERRKHESNVAYDMLKEGLAQQKADLSRRAHESLAREAQALNEMKMRTVQQMCEEMAEQGRKKRQAKINLASDLKNLEDKSRNDKAEKKRADEKAQQEMREELMRDEYRQQAVQQRISEKQDNYNSRLATYERTAGQADKARNEAEVLRQDNDEKRHLLRTDAYYAQRERARERQRQIMVKELDRQSAAVHQKKMLEKQQLEMDRELVQAASKRSMDAEMQKARDKRAEEQRLQHELRIQMVEKEERIAKEGLTQPVAMSTMNLVMRKNGNVTNVLSGLQSQMDAAKHCGKPLGRAESTGVLPLDANPTEIRRLAKEKSFTGPVPVSSVLGGVVGTLGGGGGGIQTALMATGGPHWPKATGIAIQDRKLGSAWYEGISPEALEAGRQKARGREARRMEANHD